MSRKKYLKRKVVSIHLAVCLFLSLFAWTGINVYAANTDPVAKSRMAATLKNTKISGTVMATDADGDVLTYGKLTNPLNGTVTVSSNGNWTYTPNASYTGMDSFTEKVEDGNGGITYATVNIMVAPAATDAVSALTAQHPRIMADEADFNNLKTLINTDGVLQSWYGTVKAAADGYLTAPVITYQLTGGQLLTVSREAVNRMKTLGMVYKMTGDTQYAERAWRDLQAICSFPDWNPLQFLDTAEMAAAVAIGYDWIYDYLNAAQRETVRNGIVNLAFIPANAAYSGQLWNGNDISSFVSRQDNWSFVCNGGLGLAALAIGNEESAYSGSILSNSIKSIANPLMGLSPDGGWPEGPVYWNYGMKYFTFYMAALDKALNTNFGLSSFPGVAETVRYGIAVTEGASRVNIGDDQLSEQIDNAFAMWHGKKYGKPEYFWFRRYSLTQPWAAGPEALDLLFYSSDLYNANQKPMERDNYQRKTELVTFANAAGDPNTLFAALMGGDNHKNHGDLDTGNFVFDALGQRWAMELGRENYSVAGYFDNGENGQRWTYYRKRAEGQNTLVINPGSGPDQSPLAVSKIIDYQSGDNGAYGILDMTPAYSDNVNSARRGLSLVNNRAQLLVQDEIQAKQASTVWWFMHTQASIATIDAKTVRFDLNGKKMQAKLLSPSDASFQVMAATPLPTSPQTTGANPNTGIRELAINLTGFTSGTIAVWLAPYNTGDPVPSNPPAVVPLSSWNCAATLLRNDFENLAAGSWTSVAGIWGLMNDGTMTYQQSSSSTANAMATAGLASWTNYEAVARIKADAFDGGGYAGVGLNARYQDPNNTYTFQYYKSDGKLHIQRKLAGTVADLVTPKAYSFIPGNWYDFRIVVNGADLELWINGNKELAAADTAFTSGKLGLYAHRTKAKFDDVKVTAAYIYRNDFENGSSSGWTPVTGTWGITDDGTKVYRQSNISSPGTLSVTGSEYWSDYDVAADVKVDAMNPDGYAGVALDARYQDPNNTYRFMYYKPDGKIRIRKVAGGVITDLVTAAYPLNDNTWYTLRGVVDGNNLEFWINGSKVLSTTDSTFTMGKIALYVHKADVKFDNVTVIQK